MAVTKTISYVNNAGTQKTVTVTFDLQKISAINNQDEEIYLVVTAPGLSTDQTWRKNIDGICEDALYCSASGTDPITSKPNSYTRYKFSTPSGYFYANNFLTTAATPSGYAFGERITPSGIMSGYAGVGISGIIEMLKSIA